VGTKYEKKTIIGRVWSYRF